MEEDATPTLDAFRQVRGKLPALVRHPDGRPLLICFAAEGGRGQVVALDPSSGETHALSGQDVDCADLAAVARRKDVTVVWSELTDGAYQLFETELSGSAPRRVTDAPSSAVCPALTTDVGGRPVLAYQCADADGKFSIHLRRRKGRGWSDPVQVSDSPGNNWCPAVTRLSDGRIAVAWDGYAAGSYDIYLRLFSMELEPEPTMRLTGDALFHANVSLAPAPDGAVWVAWNRGTPRWGKDNEVYRTTRIAERGFLHARRFLEVRRVAGDRVLPVFPPVQDVMDEVLPGLLHERPRLFAAPDGPLHLAFRFNEGELRGGHRNEKRWQAMVTCYDGQCWSDPVELAGAHGLSTGPVAVLAGEGGAAVAAACGEGAAGREADLNTSCFLYELPLQPDALDLWEPPVESPAHEVPKVRPRVSRHVIHHDGRRYRLFFGDVHRHTEFSFCRTSIDGSLEEAFRQTRDAAGMDFAMTADHDMQEAAPDMWAEVMGAADRFYVPGHFTTLFGYEWIGGRNNTRHRNVVSTERVSPPPFRYEDGHRDVRELWATLPRGRAITVPHHTACGMSLVWLDAPGEATDPEMEPLVEIFQASRSSSEHPGCPTLCNSFYWTGQSRGFNVEGAFVSDALRRGIRMGFIASSDHMSAHRSYACLYARENTREGLMEAMLARRAYAATDAIVCEFAVGDAIMGETAAGDAPLAGRVMFAGTGPIREVAIMRDSEPWRTWGPGGEEMDVTFELTPQEGRGHYFSVPSVPLGGMTGTAFTAEAQRARRTAKLSGRTGYYQLGQASVARFVVAGFIRPAVVVFNAPVHNGHTGCVRGPDCARLHGQRRAACFGSTWCSSSLRF